MGVASTNIDDAAEAVKLLKALHESQNSKIIVVADVPEQRAKQVKNRTEFLKKRYGIQLVYVSSSQVNEIYRIVDKREAENIAEKWINEAEKVVEPTRQEIINAARLYLALKSSSTSTERMR